MSKPLVSLDVRNRIGRLTLQRPEEGNAFTTGMMVQFLEALGQASAEVDVLLLAAEGRDFSLGRDRKEPPGHRSVFDAFHLVTDVNKALAAFPGILVSAVQGRTLGFGVGLVMRTDIALAAQGASFALDEVQLGIPPMFIMAEIVEHLTQKSASDVVLTSREFGAREARDIGLVSRVVADGELMPTAENVVEDLRSRDPEVLRVCKRYLRSVREVPRSERADYALAEQSGFAKRNVKMRA
jgi:enoyl-CoA hydratase/carnithine racemase